MCFLAYRSISRAQLYCPHVLKPEEDGHFEVRLSSFNHEWINSAASDYGPVSFEWWGDLPESVVSVNKPILSGNFPIFFSKF